MPGEVLWGKLGLRGADKVSQLSAGGAWVKVHAPGRGERTPSCQVWLDSQGHLGWKDYGSGDGGDEVSLIELVQGLGNVEAIKYYCELAGASSIAKASADKGRKVKRAKVKKPVEVPVVDRVTDFETRLRGRDVLEKPRRVLSRIRWGSWLRFIRMWMSGGWCCMNCRCP